MSAQKTRTVRFLTDDPDLAKVPVQVLAARGVDVQVCASVETLKGPPESSAGLVIALDSRMIAQDQRIGQLMEGFATRFGSRPDLVCIARTDDLELRLQALRAGAKAFFRAQDNLDELTERLLDLSGAAPTSGYRVLVVDDQPVAAMFAARTLQSAGMQTRVVEDPLRILDGLTEFRPDLILMDLHMPGASGIELTSIIRDHEELAAIPVIFLSRELDANIQLKALRVGGDDFIAKPVSPSRLIEITRDRIVAARSRKVHRASQMTLDALTGLPDRQMLLRRLNRTCADTSAFPPGCGLLFIQIAFTGGEKKEKREGIVADSALAAAANVLRSRSKPGELAARVGPASFAVIATRADKEALTAFAELVRIDIGRLLEETGQADGREIRVGIGAASHPADDAFSLLTRAEKAAFAGRPGGAAGGLDLSRTMAAWCADDEKSLLGSVEQTLRTGGLELFFQPIVALRRSLGERYDTVVRLRDPDGEYIPALEILPVSANADLQSRIDRFALGHALEVIQQQREQHPRLRLFVSQSLSTIGKKDWILWFRDQILERGLLRHRPVLQFRLAEVVSERALAVDLFAELQRLGVKLCLNCEDWDAVDEDLIGQLPISLIRLPSGIVESAEAVVPTDFVQRWREQGWAVIASGIDSPKALARVWQCGVEFVQGSFLQMPSPELEFDFSEVVLS